jgi:hypothetical protein
MMTGPLPVTDTSQHGPGRSPAGRELTRDLPCFPSTSDAVDAALAHGSRAHSSSCKAFSGERLYFYSSCIINEDELGG